MLLVIAILLLVLWGGATFAAYTMGGIIHILLVIAVVMIVLHLFRGSRTKA
jgi:hypothetical protein